MKTSQKIILQLVLLLMVKLSSAQMLIMDGIITNDTGQHLHGYYELRNSEKQLVMGMGTKLRLKLPRNEVYTLTISKPGYQTKSIEISTFESSDWSYVFLFDVTLKRMNVATEMKYAIVAGKIFYDPANYEYTSTLNMDENMLEASGKSVAIETGYGKN